MLLLEEKLHRVTIFHFTRQYQAQVKVIFENRRKGSLPEKFGRWFGSKVYASKYTQIRFTRFHEIELRLMLSRRFYSITLQYRLYCTTDTSQQKPSGIGRRPVLGLKTQISLETMTSEGPSKSSWNRKFPREFVTQGGLTLMYHCRCLEHSHSPSPGYTFPNYLQGVDLLVTLFQFQSGK